MASSLPSLVRPTANRAVHLRITPRPSNIGESREILRLISHFGEIEFFKNLKYDALPAPNAAIVIFRENEAAQHCLKKSPIRFRMGRALTPLAPSAEQDQTSKHSAESTLDTSERLQRIFQIQANPARAHFRDQLNISHFHGAFQVDGKSAAQQDLAKRVPTLGLSDVNWRAEDKPWKVMTMEKEKDGSFRGSGRRMSLKAVWEEGESAGDGGPSRV